MTALSLERLRREGQALMEEISRETYLAHSGLKQNVELQPIYQRHREALSDDAFELALGLMRSENAGAELRRSGRLLIEWELEGRASRALAELEEREVAWQNAAVVVTTDGREIPYQSAPIELANTGDRKERMAIDDARATLVRGGHAPLRLEYLRREKEVIESLGVADGYNESFELVSGISLARLAAQCEEFLRDTQSMWDDTLRHHLRTQIGIAPRDAKRSDALALFRASEFDAAFPGGDLESAVSRQVREMGIDPVAGGRIRFDLAERQGKHARAFCAPVSVPDEVYLVMRPHGGQNDYATFLHELGHALHFANARADLPFELRWLGDNSVTESYAMLFDHRMQDRGWLLRYTQLGASGAAPFLRMAGFEELHFLRRYSAKLIYEVALYSGGIPWEALPDLFVSTLTSATGFEYRPEDAFVDVDPRFYSARYLRAWQLQSAIAEHLTRTFDEDWHRNPSAGPWLTSELFSSGQRDTADEIAARLGADLSFAPIAKKIEGLLES